MDRTGETGEDETDLVTELTPEQIHGPLDRILHIDIPGEGWRHLVGLYTEEEKEEIETLATKWMNDTFHFAFIGPKMEHPDFAALVDRGKIAIHVIVDGLREHMDREDFVGDTWVVLFDEIASKDAIVKRPYGPFGYRGGNREFKAWVELYGRSK